MLKLIPYKQRWGSAVVRPPPQIPYPGAKDNYDSWTKKYGTNPDCHGAEAYGPSIHVIADSRKRAKEFILTGVRDALAKTNMMTTLRPRRLTS